MRGMMIAVGACALDMMALSLMGICSDALAAPREPFNAADRELVRQRLVELGAL